MSKKPYLPYGKVNVKLFQRVKAAILEEPKRLNMNTWFEFDNFDEDDKNVPRCNTVACIAGWACALDLIGKAPKSPAFVEKNCQSLIEGNISFRRSAAQLLNLPEWAEEKVFYPDQWPEPFHSEFTKLTEDTSKYPAVKIAKLAAKMIDWICGLRYVHSPEAEENLQMYYQEALREVKDLEDLLKDKEELEIRLTNKRKELASFGVETP